MKIQIEGEPKEIAELLQAIEGSKEQFVELDIKKMPPINLTSCGTSLKEKV